MSLDEWNEKHQADIDRKDEGPVDLLFLGDSITQGWNENAVWQEHYADKHSANFGIGGDTTQEVLWRITEGGALDGIAPDVAVLLIGTNNIGRANTTMADIARGVAKIVSTVQEKSPITKVLVLGVFPRSRGADDRARGQVKEINEIVAKLDNGTTIRYLDIGDSFLEEDGSLTREVSRDALHLTDEGYKRWAEAMNPLLTEMLAE